MNCASYLIEFAKSQKHKCALRMHTRARLRLYYLVILFIFIIFELYSFVLMFFDMMQDGLPLLVDLIFSV